MADTNYPRAGQPAEASDLCDLNALEDAYYDLHPDPSDVAQRVTFGTSGHRGSSLNTSFNEDHIAAITQAIVEYRAAQGIDGPILVGRDTHALSGPAQQTVLEVLTANNVSALVDSREGYTPTPALSHAIIQLNKAHTTGGTRERLPMNATVDGIVITPSHNPPTDGGIKYNPPHGGPADTDATNWIAQRANELLTAGAAKINRLLLHRTAAKALIRPYDFLGNYVRDLPKVLNLEVIREEGIKIAADPMGGASVKYWEEISAMHGLDLTVVNDAVDPQFGFMTLDWDEQIRMDCSSPHAMASLLKQMESGKYDLAVGNDADADRHGIVTRDAGLMNPNHYLAAAINFLYRTRVQWPDAAGIGKTLVSSSMIDRVAAGLGRELVEVPVGFKWFVPGLDSGQIMFGGEESAGASFNTFRGNPFSTDKDGILLALLAGEMMAVSKRSPSESYARLEERYGQSHYARVDAPASYEQKKILGALNADDVPGDTLAGETITAKMTHAAGNNAPIGGLKVTTENAWFAARPSGTEDVYKIYAESFLGADHLKQVQAEAQTLVDGLLSK